MCAPHFSYRRSKTHTGLVSTKNPILALFHFMGPTLRRRSRPNEMHSHSSILQCVHKVIASIFLSHSSFSISEMKRIYRGFKTECPSGIITEEVFHGIYSRFFPHGGETTETRVYWRLLVHPSRSRWSVLVLYILLVIDGRESAIENTHTMPAKIGRRRSRLTTTTSPGGERGERREERRAEREREREREQRSFYTTLHYITLDY